MQGAITSGQWMRRLLKRLTVSGGSSWVARLRSRCFCTLNMAAHCWCYISTRLSTQLLCLSRCYICLFNGFKMSKFVDAGPSSWPWSSALHLRRALWFPPGKLHCLH